MTVLLDVEKTEVPTDSPRERLTLREKMSYGFGGFVDQIMSQSFGQLSFPIYNIALGLDAKLLGIVLAVFLVSGGLFFAKYFPLTQDTMNEIQSELRIRREETEAQAQ